MEKKRSSRRARSAAICYIFFTPMVQDTGQASGFACVQASLLIFLSLLVPLVLSNHPEGAISGIVVFAVIFFFPGYLLLTLLDPHMGGGLRTLLSPVVGIVSITTAYDICARASLAAFFPILMVILSIAGAVRFALRARHAPAWTRWTRNRIEVLTAGCVTALGIAPLYWRSGRFSGREFVFYGPAGQDPLFHVTLLQRLLHHIPPDNFIVSGLRAPVYHYFDDLTLALLLRTQNALHLGATDVFDLYYRCYPVVVYFLLGALAYRTGRQLLGSARGGVLSVLLLLGGGGLGWFFGALQTVAHGSQFAAMRASLFSDWTSWDGIDSILPLVHRPAHYHGLIICLAAINVLLRPASRRNWLLAALLLGLMAGFNFTLAATFGIAAVLGSLIFLLRRQQYEARNLAWFALFVFIGSLPVNVGMLLDGLHNVAPGLPFRGPNLQFPAATWGPLLGRITPAALVPWAALILLPIVAYGVKLSGLRSMARLDLGEIRHRGTAMVFAIAFTLSFVLGMFFPYQAFGGVGIIFLQPTLWMLALFSLHPIYSWLNKHKGNWRPVVLWGMLGLTWIQALAAFNFSHRVAFRRDTTIALQKIRSTAAPGDVIAYLPSSLTERPILGPPADSTNFAVMAMTGLDGYFSSEPYSKFFAVPGLSGRGRDSAEVLAQAEQLYERRRDDVASFVKGDIDNATAARLARDNLCWIVVSGDAIQGISSPATPWYKTDDIVIYRLVVR